MKAIFIGLLFIYAYSGKAQTKIFTEEELVHVIKKFHPVVRQAFLETKIAAAEIKIARGAFDPTLQVDDARKEWNGLLYYNQQQTEVKLPTWYGVDIYGGQERVTGARLNPEETKGTVNYLGISVPVLQGLIMDKRRAALQTAKNFLILSATQQQIVINNIIGEALKTYWDWWEQQQLSVVVNVALQNATQRLHLVKLAHRLGDRPAIDTLEAFTQVQSLLIRQAEFFAAQQKAALQLATFLWREQQQQYNLPPDVLPGQWVADKTYSLEGALLSSNNHPELTQYNFKLKGLAIDKKLKFQSLLPKLAIKYNHLGPSFLKMATAPLLQNNYRLGFAFSMPLRLSEGRGEYQKAKLKIEQTLLEQSHKQVQLQNKIKQYYIEWQQTNRQVEVQQSLLKNTFALQRGEEVRFSNGESSLFLVNARELRTIEAEQKLIEIKAKNAKALIMLEWAAGILGR